MYYSKDVKENLLRSWYYDLPVRKVAESRDLIIKYCGIKLPVFYRWLSGQTPIPYSAQVIINQVAGMKIFDVEDPASINEKIKQDA